MVQIGSVALNVTDMAGRQPSGGALLATCPVCGHLGALVPRSGAGLALRPDETDRTHLDLYVGSEQEQQAEVERPPALGAQRVDWEYPEGANFVVLSDTEGNLFCVVNTEGGQRA